MTTALWRSQITFILSLVTFGWDDVGSWLAVSRVNETDSDENIIRGNVVSLDVKNCIIEGSDKLIAAAGIEDLIVVDSGDALLIIPKEKAGDIKKLLAKNERKRYGEVLISITFITQSYK